MRSYNLFSRADRDELICAVPEDRPVPSFITAPPWNFIGRVNENVIGSSSFNHEAAEASVGWNGFYLFQFINVSDLCLKTRRGGAKDPADEAPSRNKYPRQKAPAPSSKIRLTSGQVSSDVGVGAPTNDGTPPLSALFADLHIERK